MSQESDGRRRVIIEGVQPEVDQGRFPAKGVVGQTILVEADIFADGHDVISAVLLHRHDGDKKWQEVRMRPLVNDRWSAEIVLDQLGFHRFTIEGWIDHFLTWHRDLRKRVEARQADLDVQILMGLAMIGRAMTRTRGRDQRKLEAFVRTLESDDPIEEKVADLQSDDLLALMSRAADRSLATRYERELAIEVDRERAAFSTWYEIFPRSAARKAGQHGTFRDVEALVPRIARMGFDVLYLPPVHPIGETERKGRNNSVRAEPGDVGSPWAIGSMEGGHTAIHPQLGTIDDFRRLVKTAHEHRLEIAVDIAFQVSPDHPWVREHKEWFLLRPDGTIQYAENPPKKYQDIFPFNFESEAWRSLWDELRDVFRFWLDQGVRVFRVDNPHTKPLPFWEWVIGELKREHPDAIFLAEAFTRPKIMYRLAKGGFSQSYTYFAWRNTKRELTEYFTEIARPPVSHFFRPNAWPNTPDILTEYLQFGGRPAFVVRLILAATLSASYGIYGPAYERQLNAPREPGSEEYHESEKYEVRFWEPVDDDLTDLITLVNRIRRESPALQQNATLRFHDTSAEEIICFSKSSRDGTNVVITVVNLDPHNNRGGEIDLDLAALGLDGERSFQVHDLLSGVRHSWHGGRHFVQLNPHTMPAQILRIRRKVRTERDFEYYL